MGPRAPRQASAAPVPLEVRDKVNAYLWHAHRSAHRVTVDMHRSAYGPWLRERERATIFARQHRGLPEDVYERIYNAVLDPS